MYFCKLVLLILLLLLITVLKPMCVTQMVRAPKVAKLREVRSLQLTISEAHRLPFKLVPNPYCIISLNQVINLTPICFIYIVPSFISHTNVSII